MAEGVRRGRREPGGIASLVKTVEVYGEAIDYDLMTRAGLTLRDWECGRLDSRSLFRFVNHLGPDSAFYRAAHSEQAEIIAWLDGSATCALIAELIDAVRFSANTLAFKGTGKRTPKLDPYERPWAKRKAQRYGRGAIPISDFNEWYYQGGDA